MNQWRRMKYEPDAHKQAEQEKAGGQRMESSLRQWYERQARTLSVDVIACQTKLVRLARSSGLLRLHG
jgi:hypothetical protein